MVIDPDLERNLIRAVGEFLFVDYLVCFDKSGDIGCLESAGGLDGDGVELDAFAGVGPVDVGRGGAIAE